MEYEFSSIRAMHVVKAFVKCVENKSMSEEYAITLIEDSQKYGYLTDSDKEYFYNNLPVPEPEVPDMTEEPDVPVDFTESAGEEVTTEAEDTTTENQEPTQA